MFYTNTNRVIFLSLAVLVQSYVRIREKHEQTRNIFHGCVLSYDFNCKFIGGHVRKCFVQYRFLSAIVAYKYKRNNPTTPRISPFHIQRRPVRGANRVDFTCFLCELHIYNSYFSGYSRFKLNVFNIFQLSFAS